MTIKEIWQRIDKVDSEIDTLFNRLDRLEKERKRLKLMLDKAHDTAQETAAFVASLLMQGDSKPEPMTLEEAHENVCAWLHDGVELPYGMTILQFCEEYNRQVKGA